MQNRFSREERLRSANEIKLVYNKGAGNVIYPFRYSFLHIDKSDKVPVKVLFAVSKKRIKKAVQRNLIKRRMREAYRLNKNILAVHSSMVNSTVYLIITYIADDILLYQQIEEKIVLLLRSIADHLPDLTEKC